VNAWLNIAGCKARKEFLYLGFALSIMLCANFAASPAQAAPPPSKAEATQDAKAMQNAAMERLFAELKKIPGIEATFKEEKHLQLLALPLESEGVLYFHQDGYLLRKINEPTPSSVRVTPTALIIEEGGKTQRMELASHEEVAHMVQSFLWILAGDLNALRTHFRLHFETADVSKKVPEDWTLTLTPTHAKVKKLLQKIVVQGDGVRVRKLRIEEQGGDVTETQILSVDTARSFSKEESKKLFGRAP